MRFVRLDAPSKWLAIGLSTVLLSTCARADNSPLFTELKERAETDGKGMYPLDAPTSEACGVACIISQLKMDRFTLEVEKTADAEFVTCGSYTVPIDAEFGLIRRGNWPQDNYSYSVILAVTEECEIAKVYGVSGPLVWF